MILSGQKASVAPPVNDLIVTRVGRDPSTLPPGRRLPIELSDRGAVAAVPDPDGRVVLLCAIDAPRKAVVGSHAIELGRRLVVVGGEVLAAVESDLCTPIIPDHEVPGLLRVDPQVMVVAVWRLDRLEGLSAVLRLPEANVEDVDRILVTRVSVDPGVVPGALAELALVVDPSPGLPRVFAPKDSSIFGFHDRPEPVRILRTHRDAIDADDALGQPLVPGDLGPRVSSVDALVHRTALAPALQ
jgi:hypothetical protein